MPTWRKLHTKITESLDFNGMPDDFTRLLWVLLPLALDKEGRCLDHAGLIKAKTMPLREDVELGKIEEALQWYDQAGMILRYEADGVRYICIPTFNEHQGKREREAESKIPPPPLNEQSTLDVDVEVEERRGDVDTPTPSEQGDFVQ